MARWLTDIVRAMENLGGCAEYEELYSELQRIRRDQYPRTWQKVVRTTIRMHSSDSLSFRENDVFFAVHGIGGGSWGLRSALDATPLPSDLEEPDGPERRSYVGYRIMRDSPLTRRIKRLHDDRCQICGLALPLSNGGTYSEAHHIKPLGGSHCGPDIAANILVLCPNHHAQCDYGAMSIHGTALRLHPEHVIGAEFIKYHNSEIYLR
jgi:hypothetical protein